MEDLYHSLAFSIQSKQPKLILELLFSKAFYCFPLTATNQPLLNYKDQFVMMILTSNPIQTQIYMFPPHSVAISRFNVDILFLQLTCSNKPCSHTFFVGAWDSSRATLLSWLRSSTIYSHQFDKASISDERCHAIPSSFSSCLSFLDSRYI